MSNNSSSAFSSSSPSAVIPRHFATVSPHFSLFFGSLIAFVTFVGVLANAFVVVAVAGDTKMRRSPMNLLLLNLAVADLLYLLAFTPFWASMSVHGDGGWHFPESFCPIGRYLSNCLLIVSIFTYVAICVERFVAIVHPMHAAIWCTRSRVLLAVLGLWTFVLAYQLPYLALFQTQSAPWHVGMRICRSRLAGKSSLWRAYKWSEFMLTYALPVLLSASLYARICRVLWAKSAILHKNVRERNAVVGISPSSTVPPSTYRPNGTMRRVLETKLVNGISQVTPIVAITAATSKAQQKGPEKASQKSSSSSTANVKARRNVVKMLMICVTLFFLCYTPMVIYFLWGALFGRPLPLPFEFVFLTSTFVQFQSAFNPFLYTLFATKFREKLANMVKRKQKQRNDNLRRKTDEKEGQTEGEGEEKQQKRQQKEQNGHKASAKSSISSLGGA